MGELGILEYAHNRQPSSEQSSTFKCPIQIDEFSSDKIDHFHFLLIERVSLSIIGHECLD